MLYDYIHDQLDISREEIIDNLYYCLCYKLQDTQLLKKLILEITENIPEYYQYDNYFKFFHTKYKNEIIERYNYISIKVDAHRPVDTTHTIQQC